MGFEPFFAPHSLATNGTIFVIPFLYADIEILSISATICAQNRMLQIVRYTVTV